VRVDLGSKAQKKRQRQRGSKIVLQNRTKGKKKEKTSIELSEGGAKSGNAESSTVQEKRRREPGVISKKALAVKLYPEDTSPRSKAPATEKKVSIVFNLGNSLHGRARVEN